MLFLYARRLDFIVIYGFLSPGLLLALMYAQEAVFYFQNAFGWISLWSFSNVDLAGGGCLVLSNPLCIV